MKQTLALAATAVLALGAVGRAAGPAVSGDYVEVRTAEVFTGGCTMAVSYKHLTLPTILRV